VNHPVQYTSFGDSLRRLFHVTMRRDSEARRQLQSVNQSNCPIILYICPLIN